MNECETPLPIVLRYRELDPFLGPWAAQHGLHITTRLRNDEIRAMPIVDDTGDTYHLGAAPDLDRPGIAIVGVDLFKRGDKMHHAFYRERRRFSFQQSVPVSQLTSALDACWQRVHEWIAEAGHTRTPA